MGMPLIVHGIRSAQKIPKVKQIIVSTDCEQIMQIAREFNADAPELRQAI